MLISFFHLLSYDNITFNNTPYSTQGDTSLTHKWVQARCIIRESSTNWMHNIYHKY